MNWVRAVHEIESEAGLPNLHYPISLSISWPELTSYMTILKTGPLASEDEGQPCIGEAAGASMLCRYGK